MQGSGFLRASEEEEEWLVFLLLVFLWAFLWIVGGVCMHEGGVSTCNAYVSPTGAVFSAFWSLIGPDSLS